MKKASSPELCNCGSNKLYDHCCGAIINGELTVVTAEQLMRSRFTAFARGNANYLLKTWHSNTRPAELDLTQSPEQWHRLIVNHCQAGGIDDETGQVSFIAIYKLQGKAYRMTELSAFSREKGEWRYLESIQDQ